MKTYQVTVYNDRTVWKFEGKLHLENGPAVEYVSGSKYWYIKGLMHRENSLPAIERANGSREWWVNGNRHRENGPAIESVNGSGEWYINGKELTEEQFNNRNVKELSMNELEEILKEFSMNELEEILGHKVKIVKK